MIMRTIKNVYALYKGDTFLEIGTAKELAKYLNVSERTIRFYITNVYKQRRKNSNNSIIVIKIGEE